MDKFSIEQCQKEEYLNILICEIVLLLVFVAIYIFRAKKYTK